MPTAMQQSVKGYLVFHTHCDVTFEKFYESVAHRVPGPSVLVLNMVNPTVTTLRTLAMYFDKGWVSDLVLCTYNDIIASVENELKDYLNHVLYAHSAPVSDLTGHMVIYNDTQSITVCGPMISNPMRTINLATYTLAYQANMATQKRDGIWGFHLRNVLFTDTMMQGKNRSIIKQKSARLQRFLDNIYIKEE